MILDVISPHGILQIPETTVNDILKLAIHHPHQHREGVFRKGCDNLLADNRRRPAAFPLLQSSLTALEEKCRPVCVDMTWGRLITQGLCDSGGRGRTRKTERCEEAWVSPYPAEWNLWG